MASKTIYVNLNINGNEIQNVLLHVLASAPSGIAAGHIYYDSTENRIRWYDGSQWNSLYTINDGATTTTNLWSATQIQNAINTAVTAGMTYQGGYDAGANSPDLDTAPSGIELGYMYTVTVAGTFFSETVSVGDVLISEVDNPTTLADWTIVERNLNTATETSEGTVEIATQAEVDAGVDTSRSITPATLTQYIINAAITSKFAVDLDGAGEAAVVRVFAGGQTTFTVTHNLGTLDTVISVVEIATGEVVVVDETAATANTTNITFNGNIADNLYRVTIIG